MLRKHAYMYEIYIYIHYFVYILKLERLTNSKVNLQEEKNEETKKQK